MRKAAWCGAVLVLLGSLSGCGQQDTFDSLMQEDFDWLNAYVSLMERVKDVKSAERVKDDLEELAKKGQDINKRFDALGKVTKEEQEKLKDKYNDKLAELLPKLQKAWETKEKYDVLRQVRIVIPKR